MFREILVPFDFGKAAERALDLAIDLGKSGGARLTVLHVCEIPPYVYAGLEFSPAELLAPVADAARDQLDQLLRDLQARLPGARGAFQVGTPSDLILAEVASGHYDLVVMGTHGRKGIAHLALGSVAEKVVRMSPVPVLTVHAKS